MNRRFEVDAAAVIVTAAAIVIAVVIWPRGSQSSWTSLPNPPDQGSSSGHTIGEGGGQGPSSMSLPSPTPSVDLSLSVVCRGSGNLRMTIGRVTSAVQCFGGGKSVAYNLTTAPSKPADSIEVSTGPNVQWRIVVAAA